MALTMMRQFSRTAIFSLIAMGTASIVPLSYAQTSPSNSVQDREVARRNIAVRDARQLLQEARSAYQAKKYSDAVELYGRALHSLPDAPATAQLRQYIKESLSDALIAKAIDYRAVGRTDEALSFLQEAIELSPKNERAKAELVYTSDTERTNPALTPQHIGDVGEVNRLLGLGHGQLDLGLYDQAVKTFESVLQYDPHNKAAQSGIEKATNKKIAFASQQRSATRAKMLADVDAGWDQLLVDGAEPADLGVPDVVSPGLDTAQQDAMAARLEEMVMPTIVFDEYHHHRCDSSSAESDLTL